MGKTKDEPAGTVGKDGGAPGRKKPEVGQRRLPNPGSYGAIAMGCECAVMDNSHGRGYHGQPGVFVICASCPVHGGKRG